FRVAVPHEIASHTVTHPRLAVDPRAVARALLRYPVSRNRMPDPFLRELNRCGSAPDNGRRIAVYMAYRFRSGGEPHPPRHTPRRRGGGAPRSGPPRGPAYGCAGAQPGAPMRQPGFAAVVASAGGPGAPGAPSARAAVPVDFQDSLVASLAQPT